MSATAIAEDRTTEGRFAPGRSGNPAGRPKGARNKATLLAGALLDESAPELMRNLIDTALAGDRTTARFLAARLCPIRTDQPVHLEVEPGQERDLLAVHAAAVRALCDGEITPKEALAIARILAIGAKLRDRAHRLAKERRKEERTRRATPAAAPSVAATPAVAATPTVAAPTVAAAPRAAGGRVPAAAPVSDLYSARASAPAAARGESGSAVCDPSRAGGERRHPARAPQAGKAERPPVSDLYFSHAA
jgi:hypothetical protein